MRRAAVGVLVTVMALVLAGCPTAPPGYWPPAIESYEVVGPVQPGGTLRMVLDVRDDEVVTSLVTRRFYTPSGTWLNAVLVCDIELTPQEGPEHVSITIECPMPEIANNGTWQLEVQVNDGPPQANYPGSRTNLAFEMTGGSDDRTAPRLLEYSTDPEVIDQETPFTLTMRLQEETPPVALSNNTSSLFWFVKLGAPNSTFRCQDATQTTVSPTEVDVTLTCTPENYYVSGRSEVGLHRSGVTVRDALGHERATEMFIDVQPA